jgi:hypothetical protein
MFGCGKPSATRRSGRDGGGRQERAGLSARVQGGEGALIDFLGLSFSGNSDEQATLSVEIGEGRGAGFVGSHANADALGAIVFALEELAAAMIAHAWLFRGAGLDMEDGFAAGASAATAEPGDNLVDGQFVAEDGVKAEFLGLEEFFEGFGLGDGAGEAVQEKTALAAHAADAFGDEGKNSFVGDKIATAHEFEGGSESGRALRSIHGFGGTKNVAGGELAGAEVGAEKFGLGAFADAGSAQKDEAMGVLDLLGLRSATSLRATEPRFAISFRCHIRIIEKARDSPETHYANNRQFTKANPSLC